MKINGQSNKPKRQPFSNNNFMENGWDELEKKIEKAENSGKKSTPLYILKDPPNLTEQLKSFLKKIKRRLFFHNFKD